MSDNDRVGPPSERYLSGEGDSNQLPREDTLIERGVDDILDEGYSPPDYPRGNRYGETALEELRGESLDQRLAEEEPDVWVAGRRPPKGREPDRAGRIVEDDDTWRAQDIYAADAGVAGGAASAEEAAMHIVEPPEGPQEDEDAVDQIGEDDEFPDSGTDSDGER